LKRHNIKLILTCFYTALEKPIIAHDPSTVSAAGANLFSKSEHLEKLPPRLNQVPSEGKNSMTWITLLELHCVALFDLNCLRQSETEQFHDALTALPDLDTPADPKSLAGKSKAFEHSESFNDFEVDATTGNLNPKGTLVSSAPIVHHPIDRPSGQVESLP
jgi:hypothetical protein